ALVPEDRKSQGLVAELSVGDNLNLAALARRPPLAWRDRAAELWQAATICASLDVRPPRPEVEARRLSGGNQQKVVLGKLLALEPRVLLLDEPTRGVDVGARAEIHRRLRLLASGGVAILLSSAESEEILALADRVLVLRRGDVAGTLEGADLTEQNLLRLAAGA
ncbi:MAG TPA: ATP-binding cassette domain-containing protein, partial [Thermoanaerobaculia bacterium]|nr:ATP-binding cassette domain-containing protein [Thermoanaerobaculia bacterium]